MKVKVMAVREVYKLFVDAWMLYRKYSARKVTDAECEEMIKEVDMLREHYQSEFAEDLLVCVLREISKSQKGETDE